MSNTSKMPAHNADVMGLNGFANKAELSIKEKVEIVRLPDGGVFRRTTYNTGNMQHDSLFAEDYKDDESVIEVKE